MNDLFDDHIGDALHRAAAGMPEHAPGFGDVRRRVRHRRRVQAGLAAVPVVAGAGLLALRHSPVAVPLTPGALGTAGEGTPTTSPLSDCYVVDTTAIGNWSGVLPTTTLEALPVVDTAAADVTTSSIGGVAASGSNTPAGDPTTSYPGGTSTTIVMGDPASTVPDSYVPSSYLPTTSFVPSAMPSTIPCDGTNPVTLENGLPTTTILPMCDTPTASSPCLEMPADPPTVWESGLTISGIVYRLTSDPSGNSDGICQWFNDTMSGCDSDLQGNGRILNIVRYSDDGQVLVFGVARPGVQIEFGLPDGNTIAATMGDGDWRIAWAIALPADLVDILDQGGLVLRLYPAGVEPGSDLTPDTMLVDAPLFEEMSVLDLGATVTVPADASTTTSVQGG